MLLLRRRRGETVLIGDHVAVTVVGVDADGDVMIGFHAPSDILILRKELADPAHIERLRAAGCPDGPAVAKGMVKCGS